MPLDELAVAITGASGAAYGLRLVRALAASGTRRVHVIVSPGGARVLRHECGLSIDPKRPDPALLAPARADRLVPHAIGDYGASIASGSFPLRGLAVCPCSMGTLALIAAGTARNLITRAADVCLKERRKLVLVARETPLSAIHLENMLRLTRAGAVVLPAAPGFYAKRSTVDDLVDFIVARVLQQLGLPQDLLEPWKG